MPAAALPAARSDALAVSLSVRSAALVLRPLQALIAVPTLLFLLALAAMLLRHPDVKFYEIDRVAFGLLVVGVANRAMMFRPPLFVLEPAS